MSDHASSAEELAAMLAEEGATPRWYDAQTFGITTLWGPENPCCLQWRSDAGVVLLAQQLTPGDGVSDARALEQRIAAIHRQLSVLGFVHRDGHLDFRTHVTLSDSGSVSHRAVRRMLVYAVTTAQTYADELGVAPAPDMGASAWAAPTDEL